MRESSRKTIEGLGESTISVGEEVDSADGFIVETRGAMKGRAVLNDGSVGEEVGLAEESAVAAGGVIGGLATGCSKLPNSLAVGNGMVSSVLMDSTTIVLPVGALVSCCELA